MLLAIPGNRKSLISRGSVHFLAGQGECRQLKIHVLKQPNNILFLSATKLVDTLYMMQTLPVHVWEKLSEPTSLYKVWWSMSEHVSAFIAQECPLDSGAV
jgi:hypothetical protein